MVGFLQTLQVISGVLLVLLILIHSPKGDGLAAIGGAAQLFSTQKGVESGLNKLTAACAVVFFLITFLLGFGIIR